MFREYPIAKILKQLEKEDLLPAIVFRTSRRQCDVDLQVIEKKNFLQVSEEEQIQIEICVQNVIRKYDFEPMIFKRHPQYESLVKFAMGSHHAGQLLPWRLLLEEIMSQGLLRILIATGTVAAGVDFPARSVVITAHSKRGHEGFRVLSPSEFQQMSGRAGRRGKDSVGFCFIAPNPYSDARILSEVASTPPEPLRSSYFASPSTVLNLLKYRSIEELKYTVKNSLAGFVDGKDADKKLPEADKIEASISEIDDETGERQKKTLKRANRVRRKAEELRVKQVTQLEVSVKALTNMGFISENGKLTEKGLWSAELCTNLVLEFAEAINDFIFEDISIEDFICLVAAMSADPFRNYLTLKKSDVDKELFDRLAEKVDWVSENYQGSPFASEVCVRPDAGETVLAWVQSSNWLEYASLLKLGGVADGDASRIITQTADQLQQIGRLSDSHPDLSKRALDARALLLKPPIA